jgi:hypothetical protein
MQRVGYPLTYENPGCGQRVPGVGWRLDLKHAIPVFLLLIPF